jgi:hypothetical protein
VSNRVRAELPLDDETVERYARQIIVPGIGAAGQAQLLATNVAVFGHPLGVDAARAYLTAAGVRVVTVPFGETADCVLLADLRGPTYEREIPPCSIDTPIAWYELRGPIVAGGLATRATLPRFASTPALVEAIEDPCTIVAHRIGASDAAGLALAAILGWVAPGERHELHLDPRPGHPPA